ncbi:hypothetical protein BJ944DRAFT_260707 [Cunninghamella echinulata]|nr:hypothetical protein BJ944DRAFT_260707 [Cunninghamella echinulata]
MAIAGYIATFFTFSALILEIFTLLASTYNQPFIKDLNFVKFTLNDKFIAFGLWGYCQGLKGQVISCSTPAPGYIWSTAPNIGDFTTGLSGMDKVYFTNYILYWIAFGITLGALASTVLGHFGRGIDLLASLATFLCTLLMLVIFIIFLVVSLKGVNAARDANPSAYGQLGYCIWMNLGAMVALLLGSLWYCFTCIFGPPKQ